MAKSDIFNIDRFWRYLKTDLSQDIQNYGLSLLIVSCFGLIAYLVLLLFHTLNPSNIGWNGLPLSGRTAIYIIAAVVVCLTAPVKCYGSLTEKKSGTAFLMLPASRLEKYISMILISIIIIPVVFNVVFLALDLLVCAVDPRNGDTIIMMFSNAFNRVEALGITDMNGNPFTDIEAFLSPWLYIDDVLGMALIFLLGALCFKRSKTAKTIGSLIIVVTVLSLIATPFAAHKFADLSTMDINGFEELRTQAPFAVFCLEHIALVDTISDQLVNIGLMVAIWFRLKTLKH